MADLSVNESPAGTPPAPFWRTLTLKQVALGTALVALVLIGVGLLIALRSILLLLFLGIVVATALTPLVERLRQLGMSRTLAVWSAFALLVAGLGGVLGAILPFVLAQLNHFITDMPERYAALREMGTSAPTGLLRGLAGRLPTNPFAGLDQGALLGSTVGGLLPLGRGLAFGVLVLLLSYYWLYYRALAVQSVALLLPLDWRAEATEIWNQIEAKVGAFVRGLALLGITIAILSALGFWMIGLPYAFTIAIIAGILEAVPYVGPTLTLVLAALVGLSVSPMMAVQAIAVALVVQAIESSIVVPRVMDRAVGVRPVVTLLAMAVFSELFGLLGALLAVPLAAALQVLLDRLVLSAPTPAQLDIGGRDQLALLRYHTQDLTSDLRQQFRSKEAEVTSEIDSTEEQLEALLLDLDGLLAQAQGQRP